MSYKALYRTYRPSTFDEVAGQEHIIRTLKNALATKKIAHAYLFAGPRGTGKTTMARIFAKALNCEEGFGHQCNNCTNCKSINEGSHPDVIELDAASNNGVNDIRVLVDQVRYSPTMGKYKVYIIDEVHMLSDSAFNALLKTLEEPPENVLFILATTDPQDILPTILSRCQRYDFTKISDESIIAKMDEILTKEGIEFEGEALKLIASLADGGMRDALSMLDQVLAYSQNGKLNTQDVLDIFSLESTTSKVALLDDIASGNAIEVLTKVNEYFKKGTDLKRLTSDLLFIVKDVLIYLVTRRDNVLKNITLPQATTLARLIDEDKANKIIDTLIETLSNYSKVASINSIFEVSVLKLCDICKKREKITEKPAELVDNEKIDAIEVKKEETPVVENIVKQETIQYEKLDHVKAIKNTIVGDSYVINDDLMVPIMVKSNKEIKKELLDRWDEIKNFTSNPLIGGLASNMLDAHPLVCSKDVLILEFQMQSVVDKFNKVENQKVIQDIVFNAFGKHLFVYSITRKQSVDYQRIYSEMKQLDKLPKPDSVVIEFEGE